MPPGIARRERGKSGTRLSRPLPGRPIDVLCAVARSKPELRWSRRAICSLRRGKRVDSFVRAKESLGEATRAARFVARESSRLLTPHPGPLPVEGRGCATNDPAESSANHRARCLQGGAVRKRGADGRRTERGCVRRTSRSVYLPAAAGLRHSRAPSVSALLLL